MSEAVLELKFQRILVQPPLYKQRRYRALALTVLLATERDKPRGRDRIDWKLITNLPVTSRVQAIEKLQWYALRWRIEVFHKILKSGCQAEQSKLRTAERLVNLLATFCILSCRIFWLTMINRSTQKAKAALAFTSLENDILNRLAPESQSSSTRSPTLKSCLTQLARLGGYLNRAGDAPPGNIVMWRGMSRLTDIELGFLMATKNVGN
jgi:Transposase DDE domain